MNEDWIDEVIRFWFEELRPQAWFTKDDHVDALIRERFSSLYERVGRVAVNELETARACLAAAIVLDQFPRNMFRNSPRAYAMDARALAISRHAIETGLDQQLSAQQRQFVYMPFQHSEERSVQSRSVELFTSLGDAELLDYARQHQVIVDRFGRFPHRNAILDRASTPQELEFLQHHPGF